MAAPSTERFRIVPTSTQLRTPEGVRVRVHLFPPDRALSADVARIWASLAADRVDDETFREDLEEQLQHWYPRLAIQSQSDLAALTQEEEVWYVFRDGRVRAENAVRDRFYGAMSSARSTREELESTMRQAEEAAELFARRHDRRSTTSGA
jgi:hypothetical protein